MSKTRKIWLGIFTFLPLVFLIAYFIFFFTFFFSTFGDLLAVENNPNEFPTKFMSSFALMSVFIMLMSFGSLALMIYYIIHAHNNETNDTNKKLMWTLVVIFTSTIGSIVYYFIEILPIKTNNTVES